MLNEYALSIPGTKQVIKDGCKIKLGRFQTEMWIAHFGWYAYAGNREVCGWYLVTENGLTVKPLQRTDLDDIYIIEN